MEKVCKSSWKKRSPDSDWNTDMEMTTLRIRPLSPFGTPLIGDTLFGQLCWTIRNQSGDARLMELLGGYLENRPFCVVSNAFPAGYLPRPTLPPTGFIQPNDAADRKQLKRRRWIPHFALKQQLRDWLKLACSDYQVTGNNAVTVQKNWTQSHNNINRLTGTTGEGFAPYTMEQFGFAPDMVLDIHLAFDPERLKASDFLGWFSVIGTSGFGRDASIGLGKFAVEDSLICQLQSQANANAYLTLAPCAPQGCGFDNKTSHYQPFTRFGRHGDAAVQSGQPFKTPVLLAAAGAVLKPVKYTAAHYVGQGLGGNGILSRAIPETVHQGYAPVIGIYLPSWGSQP
jgi:CRISPR-associated protein Csm4